MKRVLGILAVVASIPMLFYGWLEFPRGLSSGETALQMLSAVSITIGVALCCAAWAILRNGR